MNRPLIYCIDGNIGSGKSSVLKELKKKGFCVFEEELDDWGDLLHFFYNDPHRWMFTLQIKILNSMKNQYEKICKLDKPYVFIERSPRSSTVFVQNGKNNGFICKEEETVLSNIYEKLKWNPDVIFYLNIDVDTCFKRINKRNRECESSIDLSYLKNLDSEYKKIYKEGDVTFVDGSLPLNDVTNTILSNIF